MLMATVTIRDPTDGRGTGSAAIARISEPPVRGTPRMAACALSDSGPGTVLALLGRACGALAESEWPEI